MRTSLRRYPILLLAFVAVSLIFLSRGDSALAYTPTWTGTSDTELCLYTGAATFETPCTETAADLAANAPSDRSTNIYFPSNFKPDSQGGSYPGYPQATATDTDYLFYYPGGLVTYTPADSNMNPLTNGLNVPVGAIIGRQYTNIKLGLTNNPCTGHLDVEFFFYKGTTDTGWSGGVLDPTKVKDPILQAATPAGGESTLEPLRDDDDNDGIPNHVDLYPSYLNKIFDPDYAGDIDGDTVVEGPPTTISEAAEGRDLNGDGDTDDSVYENGPLDPLTPVARATGSAIVANMAVVLEFVTFAPGATADFPAGHNLRDAGANPALGYPTFIILNDPTTEGAPSSITDFCSPMFAQGLWYGVSRDNPCTPAAGCPNNDTTCTANPNNCQLRNVCINTPNGIGVDTTGDGSIDTPCPGWSPEHGDPTADPDGCDADNNEAGCDVYHNPPAGQAYYNAFLMTRRDSDGDGMEADVDSCTNTNTGPYNSRQAVPNADDADSDGIPGGGPNGGCDPTPNVGQDVGPAATNYDGDGIGAGVWKNRADNCPLVANNDNKEQELRDPFITVAPLGGPKNDGIGDACELGSNDFIGNGMYKTTFKLGAKCIGDNPATENDDVDSDNDGFCDSTETSLGSCARDDVETCEAQGFLAGTNPEDSTPENADIVFTYPAANAGSGGTVAPDADGAAETFAQCLNADDDDSDGKVNDGCPVSGQYLGDPVQVCNDGVDNDLDGKTDNIPTADEGCSGSGWWYFTDRDGDGYEDSEETRIGTSATDSCGFDGWPSDLFTLGGSFNRLDLQDVTSFVTGTPPFKFESAKGGPGYDERWNLFNEGDVYPAGSKDGIDLQDITALVTGNRDKPPIMVGDRAFDGPTCPVHPGS